MPTSGVQQRIKTKQPSAEYVHCASHNLNLVLNDACNNVPEVAKFYDLVQKIYTFFGGSIIRWKNLVTLMQSDGLKLTLKKLCATRWSSRHDSLIALKYDFICVLKILTTIILTSKKTDERTEALSLKAKMETFEFVFMLSLQCEILKNVNIASKSLQATNVDLETAKNLLHSALNNLKELRNNFTSMKAIAEKMAHAWKINPSFREKRHQKIKRFYDELAEDERFTSLEKKIEVTVFNATLDIITAQLCSRFQAMDYVFKMFSVLNPQNLLKLKDEDLFTKATILLNKYSTDFTPSFPTQLICFKTALENQIKTVNTIYQLACLLIVDNASTAVNVPDVCTAFLLFLTLPVTVASAKRSFSKLKLIKTYLRSTMSQTRLSDLATLSIESEKSTHINIDNIVRNFVVVNVRWRRRFNLYTHSVSSR